MKYITHRLKYANFPNFPEYVVNLFLSQFMSSLDKNQRMNEKVT